MSQVMPQIAPTRHLLTVDEYHQMGEAGILHEDSRIELIEGELIDMAPIGSLHAAAVNDVTEQLIREKDPDVIVSIQNPILLGAHSEPQPDVMILRPRADRYRSALPTPEDVLLLIEIADSSLSYDRNRKIPIYARHAIAEVWLFDLSSSTLERYRDPDPQTGNFRSIDQHRQGKLSPQLLPQLELSLDEIWG
jgi:Uma2 family endonuclease